MSDSYIELNPGTGGEKSDAEALFVGIENVRRTRVQIAGVDADDIGVVTDGAPAASDHGLVTRNIPSGTQAVSVASLPLPTGASTAAKQPALGTAGTPSADVITIQGASGMSAVRTASDGSNSVAIATSADGVVYASHALAILEGRVTATIAGQFTGRVLTGATTRVAIQRNAYTEQTSGAQRSISSGSASDTAAGTGARTVRICYYTLTAGVVAGPFFETVTLNGGAAVNTVATDIWNVEYMDVETVGSGGVSAGTISIYAAAGGAGGAFGSIQAGDRSTNWCHHYVPTGKACYITDIHVGATVSGNSIFEVTQIDPTVSDAAEKWVKGLERIWPHGAARATEENYHHVPIKVSGPARIRGYVTPGAAGTSQNHLTVSYYEI